MSKIPTNIQNGLVVMPAADLLTIFRDALQEHTDNILQVFSDRQQPESPKNTPLYLTRQEAAKALKITVCTLDRRMKEGSVKYKKIGRRVLVDASSVSLTN